MGVETTEQALRVVSQLDGLISQFWDAANAQHQLGIGDHSFTEQRVEGALLQHVTQAGQPVIVVWPDPVLLEEPDPLEPPEIPEVEPRPILIGRPPSGAVTKVICHETPILELMFLALWPPALWLTRDFPISPVQEGSVEEIDANIEEIETAYANLSGPDAETFQLSRIIREDYVDQFDRERAAYVVLVRAKARVTQLWKERPVVEFPDMNLLPVEPDAFGQPPLPPGFPDDYDGPWALPTSEKEAEQKLDDLEPTFYGFPNGWPATLHDFFGPNISVPFEEAIVNSNGELRAILPGFGSRTNTDPGPLPDVELTLCGTTYEYEDIWDVYGHPQGSDNPNDFWLFAPSTFWRPDGSEIRGIYPKTSDGELIPDELVEPSPDFIYWLERL